MNNAIGARAVNYKNDSTKLSAKVTSELIKPADQDNKCTLKIWDTNVYSKYYRTFTPIENPKAGDVWESNMIVKHYKDCCSSPNI